MLLLFSRGVTHFLKTHILEIMFLLTIINPSPTNLYYIAYLTFLFQYHSNRQ